MSGEDQSHTRRSRAREKREVDGRGKKIYRTLGTTDKLQGKKNKIVSKIRVLRRTPTLLAQSERELESPGDKRGQRIEEWEKKTSRETV